jgi:hypothetical protein
MRKLVIGGHLLAESAAERGSAFTHSLPAWDNQKSNVNERENAGWRSDC